MTRKVTGRPWVGSAVLTLVYAAAVTWVSVHHEPWRDEVVPLIIVRRAHALADLLAPLRFESHPPLWYLVLWGAWAAVGQTWVLKAASVGCAVGAVFLFARSPLPWWFRCLFTFSFYPLYQYSVISRGYGLEMLALFAVCTLYPHRRAHPLALAVVLAALANTEAFGLIMAVAAAGMLAAEAIGEGPAWRTAIADRRTAVAALVYVAGVALAVHVAFPDAAHRGSGIEQLDRRAIAAGLALAVAEPARYVDSITLLAWPSAWVWGYFAYLTRRPPVLCFATVALFGLQALFNLVRHLHAPWHLGSVVLVIVAAMWLDASASTPAWSAPARLERLRPWLGRLLLAGLSVALVDHAYWGAQHVVADLRYEHSSSQRLGELLRGDPALASAIVMGEPDPPLSSLAYYADNDVYLAREQTFRGWPVFAPPRQVAYDLGALLATAKRVREERGRPVVIVLGSDLQRVGVDTNYGGTRFAETFAITPETRAEFLATTRLLGRLRGPTITDENYDVYLLR